MAQHESAQISLATKLTTARGPYGQSFNLEAPTPPPPPQPASSSNSNLPRMEMDPCSQQAIDHAIGIAMGSDIPLAAVQYVLEQDHIRRHSPPSVPAPVTTPEEVKEPPDEVVRPAASGLSSLE